MTQKAMDIEDIVKSDHLFHPMRQLQRRSGAFFSKFQESEDRQMVPSVEPGWSLFKDSQKHVTCRRYPTMPAFLFIEMEICLKSL